VTTAILVINQVRVVRQSAGPLKVRRKDALDDVLLGVHIWHEVAEPRFIAQYLMQERARLQIHKVRVEPEVRPTCDLSRRRKVGSAAVQSSHPRKQVLVEANVGVDQGDAFVLHQPPCFKLERRATAVRPGLDHVVARPRPRHVSLGSGEEVERAHIHNMHSPERRQLS
jgi:hypothetical protein